MSKKRVSLAVSGLCGRHRFECSKAQLTMSQLFGEGASRVITASFLLPPHLIVRIPSCSLKLVPTFWSTSQTCFWLLLNRGESVFETFTSLRLSLAYDTTSVLHWVADYDLAQKCLLINRDFRESCTGLSYIRVELFRRSNIFKSL